MVFLGVVDKVVDKVQAMANDNWLQSITQSGQRGPSMLMRGARVPPRGEGGDKKGWLGQLLKVALPLLAGGAAGAATGRGFEAPHGGTVGWKGTVGKGLQSYGKALQQLEEAKVAKEQEEQERQQEQQERMYQQSQDEFKRTWDMYKLERDEALRTKLAGMAKEPREKLPEEIDAIEALTKQREASAAASWALVTKRKQEMAGTDEEDMYNIPITWSKFDSIVGEAMWEQLYAEYDMAIKGKNREEFDALWDEIQLNQNKMRKMTVRTDEMGNKSMSESETKDYSNLTNMRNWMSKNLEKLEMATPTPTGKAPREIQLDRMKQLYDKGKKYREEGNEKLAKEWFKRAIDIGNKLGLNETEFADILGVRLE